MMTTANAPFNKQQKLRSIIKFLRQQGFNILKSSAKEFDDPKKIEIGVKKYPGMRGLTILTASA